MSGPKKPHSSWKGLGGPPGGPPDRVHHKAPGPFTGQHRVNPEPAEASLTPAARYTVEPGRAIFRDGVDFITIERDGDVLTPTQADAITRRIAELLNQYGE